MFSLDEEHPNRKTWFDPCAEGGSSIDEWGADQLLTRHALAETKFAMVFSELIGILWHQGENDSLMVVIKIMGRKVEGCS